MIQFNVHRRDGNFRVAILIFKSDHKYSFVNLTKGHICPCKFDSEEAAVEELTSQVGIENGDKTILSITRIEEVFNTEA